VVAAPEIPGWQVIAFKQPGLGELVTAERIHYVDVVRLPESPAAEGYMELTTLPAYLATTASPNNELERARDG
jgi:hypothetical protein